MVNSSETVASMVTRMPWTSRAFEQHKIDFCCGGKRSIADACERANISVDQLNQTMQEIEGKLTAGQRSQGTMADLTSAELIDRIVHVHHDYIRNEIPLLVQLATKVSTKHGARDPRLHEVLSTFMTLSNELLSHIAKEEAVLFPYMQQMEMMGSAQDNPVNLDGPIHRMLTEHDEAAVLLEKLREVTDDYVPPEIACNSHRAMLDGLERFDADLRQHIHLENNILFPRFSN